MKRDPRLWFPLALAAAVSLLIIVLLFLHKLAQHAPPAADVDVPDVPPWLKASNKASYLESDLHADAPELRTARPPHAKFCVVLGRDGDLNLVKCLPWEEDYADCWRGALLCEADPPTAEADGPHACRVGDFRLFGDLEVMERVKPIAAKTRDGPWPDVGGLAEPPP
jgi:hypothetical protein